MPSMSEAKKKQIKAGHRKPSAEYLLSLTPPTEDDARRVIEYMFDHGVSMRSASKQLQYNSKQIVELIAQSPELRALDSEARCNYMREKVREMNMIATLEEDVQRARLKCDNIKWEASRIMRSEFGDSVVVSGDKNNPLVMEHVVSANQLVEKIRGRTIEHDAKD